MSYRLEFLMPRLWLAFFFLFPFVADAKWDVEQMMSVRRIADVSVSPDATRSLFTVEEASMEGKKSEWTSRLWIASNDGKSYRPFTAKSHHASAGAWSPDGKTVAFLIKHERYNALALMAVDGGEADEVTDEKSNIVHFKFSPDGKKIALLIKEGESADEKKRKEEKRDVYVVDEDLKGNHLWILTLGDKNELERLTTGNFNVGTGFSGHDFDWSPDSKEIVFPKMPSPSLDKWTCTELWVVDVATKKMRKLETNSMAVRPLYSPDGKWIAYSYADLPVKWEVSSEIAIIPATGGTPIKLASTPNQFTAWHGAMVGWSKNSATLYVIDAVGTQERLYELPIDGRAPVEIPLGTPILVDLTLNRARDAFGFIVESSEKPMEVFFKRIGKEAPVQITRLNQDLPLKEIAKTEVIHYDSEGWKIEALLTYPLDYQKGKKYPLLVVIHGGPTSQFAERFIGNALPYPLATFASDGYAILRCNIRGSNGYGKAFREGNVRDWGGRDFLDIMNGVDAVIVSGVADKERLGVMGWSYGGYMTAWTITQTHRFKAASVGAGVIDLMSMTGTSDVTDFLPGNFGKELWEDYELYLQRSAIFHVKGVTTPTLIQHGSADERVPLSQAYEFYTALKRQNVPVKFVIYPRQGHSFNEPKFTLDAARRNFEWFKKYIPA